ncbi:MAG: spermidine/putrescine ABC transporter substrate-binding protein [Planctomycetota bacterium]|nr:spermidine/putrescine ABC transporter substrate-binding protein [Planctomycetota bacterium]
MTALAAAERPVLRVANWSEYIDLDSDDVDVPLAERSPTLRSFMQQYDCHIEYIEYDSENAIEAQILSSPGFFDVVIMASDLVANLEEAGRVLQLDETKVPNLATVAPLYLRHSEQVVGRHSSVPFLAGTTGIAVRKDLVPEAITSWRQYFHPAAGSGVVVLDEPYSLWSFALMALGQDPVAGQSDPKALRAASREVAGLMRGGQVVAVTAAPEDTAAALLSGKAALAIMYSGDFLTARDQNGGDKLAYVIPQEGSEVWTDVIVVMSDSAHPTLACALVNHLLSAPVQARLAVEMSYQAVNATALDMIRSDNPGYFSDPIIFPSQEDSSRLQVIQTIAPDIATLWRRLREE